MADTIEQRPLISPPIQTAVPTGADKVLPATVDTRSRWRTAWQELIDTKLLVWLREPEQLDDDGVDAPSQKILRLALDYAELFRDDGLPPPSSIVPDPTGGIVFERRQNGASEFFHFWDDGTIDFQLFHGTRLIQRRTI